MNRRSQGTVQRKEDINPELDLLKNSLSRLQDAYRQLMYESQELVNWLDAYDKYYGIYCNGMTFQYQNELAKFPKFLDSETDPVLHSNDFKTVKNFYRYMYMKKNRLERLKDDLQREVHNWKRIDEERRKKEDEERKKQEAIRLLEHEKAVKEQKFLDTLSGVGILGFIISILFLLVFVGICMFNDGDAPEWLVICSMISFCLFFIFNQIIDEGFTDMKRHISKYGR
jgi:hypothetical protein